MSPSPQAEPLSWLPALPPFLPLPRWLVRMMLERAPIAPLTASTTVGRGEL